MLEEIKIHFYLGRQFITLILVDTDEGRIADLGDGFRLIMRLYHLLLVLDIILCEVHIEWARHMLVYKRGSRD